MKLTLLILAILFLCAVPTDSQQPVAAPSKDPCKDAALEKEIADFARTFATDSDRVKLGVLVESITWKDDYRRAAIEIIQSEFPTKFVATDETLGAPFIYISGTSAVSNGAQFVSVRVEILSDMIVKPENAKTLFDTHLAKIGDPLRLMKGQMEFAEHGELLPPIGNMNYELWHQLNLETVRQAIKTTLSDFAAKWAEAGKKQ